MTKYILYNVFFYIGHCKCGIVIFLSAFARNFIKLIKIEAIYEVSHVNVKV